MIIGRLIQLSCLGQQYCPELRIPQNRTTCLPEGREASGFDTTAFEPEAAADPTIFAWYVFMAVFLFTQVNTIVLA